jgi:hypothetical protein
MEDILDFLDSKFSKAEKANKKKKSSSVSKQPKVAPKEQSVSKLKAKRVHS